jgi:hypothetical protein
MVWSLGFGLRQPVGTRYTGSVHYAYFRLLPINDNR